MAEAAETRYSRSQFAGCRAHRPDVLFESEADGLRENGSTWMNKSDMAERLAGRTGMSKAAAKDAVSSRNAG